MALYRAVSAKQNACSIIERCEVERSLTQLLIWFARMIEKKCFLERRRPGKNSFAKEFSPSTPFQKTPIRCEEAPSQREVASPAHNSWGMVYNKSSLRDVRVAVSFQKRTLGLFIERRQKDCWRNIPKVLYGRSWLTILFLHTALI
jgi:hypothetical protein